MLAELTQIDAMMGLVNGRDIPLEKENSIPKNNKFLLIEENEIEGNESSLSVTADNMTAVEVINKKKESINKTDYTEKEDTVKKSIYNEDNNYKASLNKSKTISNISNQNNNIQKHNQLIQNVFNEKSNAYRVQKEANLYNIENSKQKYVPKEIISNVYTKKQDKEDSVILNKNNVEVKNNSDSKLNNNKNGNRKIISNLNNINSKSTNTEKSNTVVSFIDKLKIKNMNDSVGKNKVISKLDSKTNKVRQIVNNSVNGADINNKTTRVEVNQQNINVTGRNMKSDISTDINKQILESIHNSISRQGIDKQITVQLNPPELGRVLIKFQEQDSQITGLLEVNKPETRLEVEQALPQIIRDLNESGIQIKKLEVISTDINQSQQELQESFKEQLFSDDDTNQGRSAANDMNQRGTDNNGFYDWFSNKSDMNSSRLENIFVGNDSINILI